MTTDEKFGWNFHKAMYLPKRTCCYECIASLNVLLLCEILSAWEAGALGRWLTAPRESPGSAHWPSAANHKRAHERAMNAASVTLWKTGVRPSVVKYFGFLSDAPVRGRYSEPWEVLLIRHSLKVGYIFWHYPPYYPGLGSYYTAILFVHTAFKIWFLSETTYDYY